MGPPKLVNKLTVKDRLGYSFVTRSWNDIAENIDKSTEKDPIKMFKMFYEACNICNLVLTI